MTTDPLIQFAEALQSTWGELDSGLVAHARHAVTRLLAASSTARWLSTVHAEGAESLELHRDALHGFLLLAHTEQAGQYRPPHDHGRGWVIYAVERGEMEMSTYRRVHDLRGVARLVKREEFTLRPGDVRVFLPGDIHDTRCTKGPLTLLRFTSRDLKKEEVTRYPAPERTVEPPRAS